MLEKFFSADVYLFFLINRELTSASLDVAMPWLRNKFIWTPLYVFIISFLIFNYKRKGILALLYLALVIILCDQISSTFLKPWIARIRPCNDLVFYDYVRLLVSCGSGFSFPSSHAANHFGAAVFLGILCWSTTRIILPVAIAWAVLVGYAQVYVGLHYPLDVAGGALLGCVLGTGIVFLFKRHSKEILK